jgi:hypothetical protein
MALAEAQGLVYSSSVVLVWWCFDRKIALVPRLPGALFSNLCEIDI